MNRYDSQEAQRAAERRAEARTLLEDPVVQEIEDRLSERVYERVTVTPVEPIEPPPLPWSWEDMRDYVMSQVESRHGPQLRDEAKEQAVFQGFLNRWGQEDAAVIAVASFEICDGMWANAPITRDRFKAVSDSFFGARILAGEIPA